MKRYAYCAKGANTVPEENVPPDDWDPDWPYDPVDPDDPDQVPPTPPGWRRDLPEEGLQVELTTPEELFASNDTYLPFTFKMVVKDSEGNDTDALDGYTFAIIGKIVGGDSIEMRFPAGDNEWNHFYLWQIEDLGGGEHGYELSLDEDELWEMNVGVDAGDCGETLKFWCVVVQSRPPISDLSYTDVVCTGLDLEIVREGTTMGPGGLPAWLLEHAGKLYAGSVPTDDYFWRLSQADLSVEEHEESPPSIGDWADNEAYPVADDTWLYGFHVDAEDKDLYYRKLSDLSDANTGHDTGYPYGGPLCLSATIRGDLIHVLLEDGWIENFSRSGKNLHSWDNLEGMGDDPRWIENVEDEGENRLYATDATAGAPAVIRLDPSDWDSRLASVSSDAYLKEPDKFTFDTDYLYVLDLDTQEKIVKIEQTATGGLAIVGCVWTGGYLSTAHLCRVGGYLYLAGTNGILKIRCSTLEIIEHAFNTHAFDRIVSDGDNRLFLLQGDDIWKVVDTQL